MHVINLKSEIDVKVAENDILHFKPRLKRRKLDDPIIVKCITCNKQYNIKKMFRLFEEERAELLMKARKFNLDSVHKGTCIYNSKEKSFTIHEQIIITV